MRWRSQYAQVQMKMVSSRQLIFILCPTLGAYGEHSSTTVGLSGHKSIALYRHTEAHRFAFDVVYTNVQAAGAIVVMVQPRGFLQWNLQ